MKKCFMIVKDVTDLNGRPRRDGPYKGLVGFFGDIPATDPGCVMLIFYPDDDVTRLKTTIIQKHSYDEVPKMHTVTTKNSIYTLQEAETQEEGIL